MPDYLTTDTELTSIANAIRTKGGTSASLTYPSGFVSAIQAIPTGVTPTGTKQISITQNGTTTEDVTNYASAEITVNVSGGGASNVVTGTFTGTTEGATEVTVSYSGNGYPIAIMVFPDAGSLNPNSTYYTTLQRYAVCMYIAVKQTADSAPEYQKTTGVDYANFVTRYKTNSTSQTGMANNGASNTLFYSNDSADPSSSNNVLRIQSKNKFSFYISATSGTNGFMANVAYRYVIFYSS